MSKIARCYVRLTIVQKEIGERIQVPQQYSGEVVLKATPKECRQAV